MTDSWPGAGTQPPPQDPAPPAGGGSYAPPPGQPPTAAGPPPGGAQPPPGWNPPPAGWAPQPAGWAPGQEPGAPYPFPRAAHKPGAVPLRPLGLTDIYDAAFRIIRFNPRATVGAALLVSALAMALPLVVTAVLTAGSGLALDVAPDGSFDGGSGDLAGIIAAFGSLGVGSVLNGLGTLFVTGLVVRVTLAAAVGRRLGLGEAWAETRGSRWRLIGLTLLVALSFTLITGVYVALSVLVVLADVTVATVLWFIVTGPALLVLYVFLYVRVVYLAVPALVAERSGIRAALRRSWTLSRKQFWRTFGIALLTVVITTIAAQVLTTPISLLLNLGITALGPEYALLGLVVAQAVSTVIAAAFVTPFTGAVSSLQYVDQRMRKEAYDVDLVQQAGITTA